MALTMVHLLAAARWAENRPAYRDCPEFYLGAISPDAIHIRDHDDKSHKDEIHLHNWREPHPEEVMAYWRAHDAPFDVGYGVHVLTDGQWVPRYRARLPGLIRDGRLDVETYYRDTWVTDFKLFRERPELTRILSLLECARVPENHPLLTRYELDEWRKLTVRTYRGECPKRGEARHITVDYVQAFVNDCTALLDETYDAVFGRESKGNGQGTGDD